MKNLFFLTTIIFAVLFSNAQTYEFDEDFCVDFANGTTTNDQWYLDVIGAECAWDITTGDKDIVIAYITPNGVDWEHEDLGDNGDGYDNINRESETWDDWDDPDDNDSDDDVPPNGYIDDWRGIFAWSDYTGHHYTNNTLINNNYPIDPVHGTWLIGLMGAKSFNSDGINGLAAGSNSKGVSIVPVCFDFQDQNWQDFADAIDYSVNSINADIIVLDATIQSGGGDVDDALDNAFNNGVFVVSPSGWGSEDFLWFPSNHEYTGGAGTSVFSVGASSYPPNTSSNEVKSSKSNYGLTGSGGDLLDLVAPGENIYTTDNDDDYINIEGSSPATMLVAATAGLMLSVNSTLTPDDITRILHETADKIYDASSGGGYNYNWNSSYPGHSRECGYGRLNTCAAVCQALYEFGTNDNPPPIQTSQTWSTDQYYFADLVITNNAVLTVHSTVYFANNAKLIIEPGAKLILDGGKLTNYDLCGWGEQLWHGVEVWGDKSENQYDNGSGFLQGFLKLKNNAIIENAVVGARLYQTNGSGSYVSNSTGGIIKAYNSSFINNKVAVDFRDYTNHSPYFPNPETENVGYFDNCDFDINIDYLESNWWKQHVYMAQVNGIKFRECDFTNTFTSQPSGHGINSWGSGFHVLGSCSSLAHPCPPQYITYTNFSNFAKAINLSSSGTYTLDCQYANFVNNGIGIRLKNVDYADILFSNFEIGYKTGFSCPLSRTANFGIDMEEGCTGFAIEENYFTKAAGMPNSTYVGIRTRESYTTYDIIYKNTFEGISYANFAEGENRNYLGNDEQGLEFQCNTNTNNAIDFIVAKKDYSDPNDNPIIRTYQGYYNIEAGNSFSLNPKQYGHFKNDGTQHITYYYNINPPTNYTPVLVLPHQITYQNTCPSHYSGGTGIGKGLVLSPEQIQESEMEFATNLDNYNNVNTLFNSLKDGGDTDGLQQDVETSWPQDMWELREELLGNSPHLSKEVLMAAADKTEVLPESVLFEILSANPDELKDEELMTYLENKEEPLPEYMISILKQLIGGVTYKTILLNDMAKYKAKASIAAYEIIRSIKNSDEIDFNYLRNWLDNLDNLNADYQIVSSYMAQNDFENAMAMLNTIPDYRQLEGDAQLEFDAYKSFIQMQVNWEQEGRNIFELTEIEINTLLDWADNSEGRASVAAQSILEFAYGSDYCNCLPVTDEENYKSAEEYSIDGFVNNSLSIEGNPNPASSWVTFDYQLPVYANEAILQITDMEGKFITAFKLSTPIGQKLWDIRKQPKGVYLYTLKAGNISKSGKLVIE